MTAKLWKDFFMTIRKTLPRYLSILLIVALGVAFFSGVRSSEPDMILSADTYYDDMNFMDIRVISTLGLTDDDVDAIREVEGVCEAEGMYSVDVFLDTGETSEVAEVQSLTGDINQFYLYEGRLPESDDECLLDEAFCTDGEYALGDTVTVRSGTSDDLNDTLVNTEFTIVGIGISPMYLSWSRNSATIGNGSVTGLIAVIPEAFLSDMYTQIFVTVDQAASLTTMTDEYEDLTSAAADAIEAIADARCDIRYHELTDEPYETLAQSKQDVADGWQQIEDARQELDDALQELTDAEEEIAQSRLTVNEAEVTIATNEKSLSDARVQLAEAQAQYDAGEAEYLENAELLAQAQTQLTEARITIAVNEQTVSQTRSLLDAAQSYLTEYQGIYTDSMYDLNSVCTDPDDSVTGRELMEEYTGQLFNDEASLPVWLTCLYNLYSEGKISENTYLLLSDYNIDDIAALMISYAAVVAYEEADSLIGTYEAEIAEGESALAEAREQLEEAENQVAEGQAQLDAASRELVYASIELSIAEEEIASGQAQLDEAKKELAEGRAELEQGEQELADGWAEYYRSKAEAEIEIADAEAELLDAEDEIADAERALSLLEDPAWYVLDRANGVQSYVEFKADANRIGAVGQLLPVIFFLVAALVSLTSMTRMVEEQRTQIGTLKALGYSRSAITAKYILYALSASLIGSILGVAVGEYVLPQVILTAYELLYHNLPYLMTPLNIEYGIISALAAIACTTIATLGACYSQLAANPATLMRPAAPKQGKRVFLERIPLIWNRLSFTSKATVRNLFRYKRRFFMTVLGIGGCMGLLLVGFGLRDSIHVIVNNQYHNIWVYDASVTIDDNADEDEREILRNTITGTEEISDYLDIRQTTTDVQANNVTKSVYLFIPQSTDNLEDYIVLKDRITGEHYSLTDNGVVITEKLATMLDLEVGDTITINDGETRRYTSTVTAISENYLYNFVYMTPAVYESLYGEEPVYNNLFMNLKKDMAISEDELSEILLGYDNVTSVTMVTSLNEYIEDMMSALDMVVWVLLISAGLLAYIVLYNLNSINITERRRELATLKVLGFYNTEVAGYVYRENVLLTIFGILLGLFLGFLMHRFVVLTLEVDMMMFGRSISFSSYILSIVITFIFALVVNLLMYYSLKKIDMVESMKSVE